VSTTEPEDDGDGEEGASEHRGTTEYPSEEGAPAPSTAAERWPDYPPPRIDPDIPGSDDPGWFRIAQNFGYESVAACRDRLDHYGWRKEEARAQAARDARERATRSTRPDAGGYPDRPYRQINVKLAVADFDAVVALSMKNDVPHSTMARMLIRAAITEALKKPGG
jgi:hypothetical protein